MASAPSPSTGTGTGTGSKPKQYHCEICGKSFDSIDTLNSHKRLDHDESGKSQSPAGVG